MVKFNAFFKIVVLGFREQSSKEIKEFFSPLVSAVPVFGRKEPEGEIGNFEFDGVVDEIFSGGFNSIAVASKFGFIVFFSPATIAITDNSDMLRRFHKT